MVASCLYLAKLKVAALCSHFLPHLLSPGFHFGFTVSLTSRSQGSTVTTALSNWLGRTQSCESTQTHLP